jgi:GT2 family glycosyltransferase
MSSANATPPLPDAAASGSLSVSIVVYRLDETGFGRVLQTLFDAAQRLSGIAVNLALIDNSERSELGADLARLANDAGWRDVAVLSGHGNVGYGAGHNLAIRTTTSPHHLILNPDVELDPDSLFVALQTLALPGVVLVGAVGRDGDGRPGYLSKRMPGVWTFFLRGFAPAWLKRPFAGRLAHYEYRDLPPDRFSDVLLVSGAFMLCRSDALQAVGGFDERYFLHFEDLDLSLRLHARGRVVSDPRVTLIHHGGHSAKKGLRHILLFARSACRFFSTHGWRWV